MGAPEAFTERMTFDLHDEFDIDGGDQSQVIAGASYPVHFGGMAVALNNSSPTVNAAIRVYDSADGSAWTLVPFSIGNQTGLLNFTLVPLSQKQILFDSNRRYIRFTTTPDNPDGVQCVIQQHVPRSRLVAAEEY